MGQVLHGSATTTEAIRRAIQHSQESLRALAKRYGINQKTVAKWKKRTSVADLPTGPREPRSTVLVGRGGGGHRRFPALYAAAARRLPLCAAADDPASDALVACIAACSATASAGCPMSRATSRRRRSSRPTRSATSTSTSPRCEPNRASSTCSSPSTAPRSSPSSNCTRRPRQPSPETSCCA